MQLATVLFNSLGMTDGPRSRTCWLVPVRIFRGKGREGDGYH